MAPSDPIQGEKTMSKCFCKRYEAKYHVCISDLQYKYSDIDRCRECTERAKRSYDKVEITRLDGESDDLTD